MAEKEERSKIEEEKIEEELVEDGSLAELFVIMPDGSTKKRGELGKEHADIEMAIKAELKEVKESSMGCPPHIKLAKHLEIAEPELRVSDSGNYRYYPAGQLIAELLSDLGRKMALEDLGAMEVRTPYIINPDQENVKAMMGKFPERLYRVLPGSKEKKQEFRLRPACDYGVWSIFKDAVISYKNLPLGLYENDLIWRYEQRGEVLGLYRLRHATMPNLHSMCADMNQAFEEFERHIDKFAMALYKYLDMVPSAIILNCKHDFYDAHNNIFKKWAKDLKIPIIIKLFTVMKTYKAAWIDVIAFDNLGRPMEVDTVQLDTESAAWWGIGYINDKGEKTTPLFLHTGFGIERTIAAILENAAGLEKKGKQPMFPLWLSPVQLRIIPISQEQLDYCKKLLGKFDEVRVDLDDSNESLGKKIRNAEKSWIPYIAVVGKKEIESGKLAVRARNGGQLELSTEEMISKIKNQTKGMPYLPLLMPKLLSKRPIFVG
ncbi:MAG: His/Gly/Thr/Pro-type tRNA ligase C-terminal domain-containing protein [Candidatus Micrarchaeota archaeon]